MEAILQAEDQIDAVYTHDDDMAEGVVAAIENAGREDEMILTGAGGSCTAFDRIEAGGLYAATYLYSPTMAGSAVNMARLIALGEGFSDLVEPEVPSLVVVPPTEVTAGQRGGPPRPLLRVAPPPHGRASTAGRRSPTAPGQLRPHGGCTPQVWRPRRSGSRAPAGRISKERRRMTTIEESIEVEVPVRTAYNQWTQFEEFPRFMAGVESVTSSTTPTCTGSRDIGGVRREWDAEITEQHPDERIAWRATDGAEQRRRGDVPPPRRHHARRSCSSSTSTPTGFVEQAGDKLGIVKRQTKADLDRFKEFIEARGTETGAWRGEVDRPGA